MPVPSFRTPSLSPQDRGRYMSDLAHKAISQDWANVVLSFAMHICDQTLTPCSLERGIHFKKIEPIL